jgi:hypothetical protein
VKWDPDEFENDGGAETFIAKLRRSPLCRQALPDAVQSFVRYLEHKRRPGESMGNYLVSEDKVNSEFQNAINALYHEVQEARARERVGREHANCR